MRIAYFGTEGKAGHSFKAIQGEFTKEEIREIEKVDCDAIYKVFKHEYSFEFFMYGRYGCLGFPASPDDDRGGSKTIIFVEGAITKEDVTKAVNSSIFVKSQFEKLSKMYNTEIPSI